MKNHFIFASHFPSSSLSLSHTHSLTPSSQAAKTQTRPADSIYIFQQFSFIDFSPLILKCSLPTPPKHTLTRSSALSCTLVRHDFYRFSLISTSVVLASSWFFHTLPFMTALTTLEGKWNLLIFFHSSLTREGLVKFVGGSRNLFKVSRSNLKT